MTVTNADHKDVLRGRDAQMVLDSEAFKSAMAGLKSAVMDQWKTCPIRDREGQVLLLQLAKLTDKFESTLIGMVQSGNFAQRRIELDSLRDEPKARQFMRRVIG